jgi:transcriptional regulator with XRE-family HTH domain
MRKWSDVKETITEIEPWEKDRLEFTAKLVNQIVSRRIELGMSQRELAEKANLKQSAIARLETQGVVPRVDTLYRIAKALDMEIELVAHDEQAATVGL